MSEADERRAKLFSRLRSQGGAFKTKVAGSKPAGPAESGSETGTASNVRAEGGSETSGARILKKKKAREGEDSGEVDLGLTVADLAPGKKKARVEKTGPEPVMAEKTGPEPAIESVPDTSGAIGAEAGGMSPDAAGPVGAGTGILSGEKPPITAMVSGTGTLGVPAGDRTPSPNTAGVPESSPPRASVRKEKMIGKKTLGELAGMAATIADEKELKKMEKNSLWDIYRGNLARWAQDGMMLSSAHSVISRTHENQRKMSEEITQRDRELTLQRQENNQLQTRMALRSKELWDLQALHKKLQEEVGQKTAEIEKLYDDLSAAESKVVIAGEHLGHAQFREQAAVERAEKAEKKLTERDRRVVELEVELGGRREERVVIEEYKQSEEYSDALTEAAAADLERCWVVTRSLTVADPNHSFDDFCDAFEKAAVGAEKNAAELETEENAGQEPLQTNLEAQADAPVDPTTSQSKDGAGDEKAPDNL